MDNLVFDSFREWRKAYPKAFDAARYKKMLPKIAEITGWSLNDLSTDGRKPRGYWKDKERCRIEALKYNHKVDWMKGSQTSYASAHKNKWIDELSAHMDNINPSGYWCFERCLSFALKYDTVYEWRDKDYNSYVAAHKKKFYERCSVHIEKRQKNIWTLETCKFEAEKFMDTTVWRVESRLSYRTAKKNGWYYECVKNFPPKEIKVTKINRYGKIKKLRKKVITLIRCVKISNHYMNQTEWKLGDSKTYNRAKNTKWLETYADIFPPTRIRIIKWNKEACIAMARNYPSKTKWYGTNRHSFRSAKKNGWMEECCAHMVPYVPPPKKEKPVKIKKEKPVKIKKEKDPNIKPCGYWVLERCKEEALKYPSKTKWRKNSRGSYNAAENKNWFNECCLHMKCKFQTRKKNG